MLFIRDSIDRCHELAAGTGARIVRCCGFDSIPSDLGVLLLHHAARTDDAGDLQDKTLVVTALNGGVSGGEVTGFGTSPAAPLLGGATVAALKTVEAGLAFGPSRILLGHLLPGPGQGPGEKTRRTGYFRLQIHTHLHQREVPRHDRSPGRPRLCRHVGDARRKRAVPRAGP